MRVSSSIPLQELISMTGLKKYDHIRDRIRAVIYALQDETAEAIALQLDRPTTWVQMWVYRYRDSGLDGLYDLPRSGSPSKLSFSELEKFVKRVLNGPLAKDEVSVLVGRDFRRILLDEFEKEYSLSGVYKLLHNIGFSSLVPRPRHDKNDPEIMKDWLKNAPRIIRRFKKKARKNASGLVS